MTMNKIIAVIIGTVLVFSAITLYFNYHGKQVQDTLITAFFTLFGAELATMGGIQITKTRAKSKETPRPIRRTTKK